MSILFLQILFIASPGLTGETAKTLSEPTAEVDWPCLEASLSLANGIQTMLMQSWEDTIRVFPALPYE